MRQVFRMRPWIFPPESQAIQEIFVRYGVIREFAKGAVMEHGGKGDAAQVGFLTKGLATFSCLDVQSQTHIFALLAPGRALGDLDALNPHRVAVQVDFIRPSSVLIVPRARFLESLRASVEMMEIYADLAILKQESALEGMLANFTLDLEARLRVFLLSAITSFAELQRGGWNLCPLGLTITELSRILSADRSWVSTKVNDWIKLGDARKDGRKLYLHGRLFDSVWDWGCGKQNLRSSPEGLKAEPKPIEHYAELRRKRAGLS